jgi:hypothetical protein
MGRREGNHGGKRRIRVKNTETSPPVNTHPARRNHPAEAHPAVVGGMMRKKNIQPPAGLRGLDSEFNGFF